MNFCSLHILLSQLFPLSTSYLSYSSLLGKAGGKGKSDDEMQGEEDEEDQDGEHPEDSED